MLSGYFPYGIVELPFWGYALVTFGLMQLMFLGITLYLHRDQSHGGLELHPTLRHIFRFWLWFSSGTVTREWVAVHRRHHAFADQPGDPHSPAIFGLKKVVLEGYELYKAATADPQILDYYGRGTPDDWIERNLYSRWPAAGLVFFILSELILFGVPGIVMVAVHVAAQPFFAGGVINGVGHRLGYRSFEMASTATKPLNSRVSPRVSRMMSSAMSATNRAALLPSVTEMVANHFRHDAPLARVSGRGVGGEG